MANGMEIMIKSLFNAMGVNPAEIMQNMDNTVKALRSGIESMDMQLKTINARLERIEMQLQITDETETQELPKRIAQQ